MMIDAMDGGGQHLVLDPRERLRERAGSVGGGLSGGLRRRQLLARMDTGFELFNKGDATKIELQ